MSKSVAKLGLFNAVRKNIVMKVVKKEKKMSKVDNPVKGSVPLVFRIPRYLLILSRLRKSPK